MTANNTREPVVESALDAGRAQLSSSSYLLPVADTSFLLRDEMRAIRFALEYAKAELILRDWHIRSTIIVFGSPRVPSPESVRHTAAEPADQRLAATQRKWYAAAREFGRLASVRGGALSTNGMWRDNVVATGGGPGLMEAANRGAREAGAPTIGFNITLPNEQRPNPYTTPELTFRFHYFAMRKMHLVMRANALAIFPGGFGTLDELFEILTLQQNRKAPPMPIVLYDRAYWRQLINFDALLDTGMIDPAQLSLFEYADSAEDVWQSISRRGLQAHPAA
ncbi:MAG: TIGR00730 family Rossman fold protein [Steroidobacteraceae bacterium]